MLQKDFNLLEIPNEFYSKSNNKKFIICSLCNTNLIDTRDYYIIEKVFVKKIGSENRELLFEYALCGKCHQDLRSELSEESKKNLDMYFKLYIKPIGEIKDTKDFIKNKLSKCFVSNNNVFELDEYQIIGHFLEDKIMLDMGLPIVIGPQAIEEIQELLSKPTKDIIDGFTDKVLPPHYHDIVPQDKFILI